MSRPLRLEFSGAYYHVMNRGLFRGPIFQDELDRKEFLKLLGEVNSRWNLQIYAYCLMEHQYHLSVQTPTVFLSRIMRHINGVYTQKFNQRHKRDGPLFRGRYKAVLVEKDSSLLTVIRYIHQKPFVLNRDYQSEVYRSCSSYYYLGNKIKPPWLDTEFVQRYFFNGDKQKLLKFMTGKDQSSQSGESYDPESQGPLLGSEEFKARIRSKDWFRVKQAEIPERRYLAVGMKTCIKTVSSAYGTDEKWIKRCRRGERNEPRQVAMYICREAGGYRHREIAEAFEAGSYSTVSSACALLKKRMKMESDLRKKVMKIFYQIIHQ
jgi:REP-associated tyrosine transposase